MSSAKDILESVSALLAFITSHLSSWNLNLTITGRILLSPRSTEGGMGVYWIHPDVCPSVWRQLDFRIFFKKLLAQLISYLSFTLMGWVSWPLFIFVFLASFLALWYPNIWPKMGFPELFEKTIGPIHFIPGNYPSGVSLLTPIHFRVPSIIFVPLVAKYLAENGVSGSFWKNY